MKYTCEECGQEHEDLPALTFRYPDPYFGIEQFEGELLELTPDRCVIQYPDEQTYYFIRTVLTIPIIDNCQDLDYGLWVSLSEKSFYDYKEHYDDHDYDMGYFAWLSNQIPEYQSKESIKLDVVTQPNGWRPRAYVQSSNDPSEQIVKDFFDGISMQEAIARVDAMNGK